MISLMTRIALALLVVLPASACSGTRLRPSVGTQEAPPNLHVLPNGVAVVIQEQPASDVATLQLWVRAGSRDEGPSELGLAHYLEHMLFKGTPTRPPGAVAREVERVGGRMNAATSLDYTYYHVTLPAAYTTTAIEILADVGVNASLDEALLEHEKSVVLEEMRLGEDNPRGFLGRRLYAIVFDGHPYGRPVIGEAELIRRLTRDMLVAFYRRHYVPEAFVLVVAGGVDRDQVLAVTARTFGRLPRSGGQRLPLPSPAAREPRREEVTRPGAHAYLGIAWHAPRLDHADAPAMAILAATLGQGRTSRLTQALREHLGLVNWIGGSYIPLEAAGVVNVSAQLDPAMLVRVENEILREIRRAREEGISEAELRRAVTAAEAYHEFSRETTEGQAYALGRAQTIWRIEAELAWVDRLRAVTVEQIRSTARRYLDPDRYVRLAVVPPARPAPASSR